MKNVRISEIMTNQVHFVTPQDDLLGARRIMDEYEIHHLPVMEAGKLIGVISSYDIARVEYLSEFVGEKLNDHSIFKSLSIPEVMAKDVYFLSSASSISEAVHVFAQANFHCLPIIDNDVLVGIVTTKDLFRYIEGSPS